MVYGYDAFGRLSQVSVNPVASNGTGPNLSVAWPVMTNITYGATGAISGWTWGDGTPYAMTRDEFDRPTGFPLGKPNGMATPT